CFGVFAKARVCHCNNAVCRASSDRVVDDFRNRFALAAECQQRLYVFKPNAKHCQTDERPQLIVEVLKVLGKFTCCRQRSPRSATYALGEEQRESKGSLQHHLSACPSIRVVEKFEGFPHPAMTFSQ